MRGLCRCVLCVLCVVCVTVFVCVGELLHGHAGGGLAPQDRQAEQHQVKQRPQLRTPPRHTAQRGRGRG